MMMMSDVEKMAKSKVAQQRGKSDSIAMACGRLLSFLLHFLVHTCTIILSFSKVEILLRPNAFDLGGGDYLFSDVFLSADNRSIHIISREYGNFRIDYESIVLYVSNRENVIHSLNTTGVSSSNSSSKDLLVNGNCEVMYHINSSDLITDEDCTSYEKIGRRLLTKREDCYPLDAIPDPSHHGNESCLTSMRPTRVSDKDNRESSVIITFTNDLFASLLRSGDRTLKVAFSYKNMTTPLIKLDGNPLIKNSTLSIFTLFKYDSVKTLKVWIQYYAVLGVDQFIFYYNGDPICIDTASCVAKEVPTSCGRTKELSCFIKELRSGKSNLNKQYPHINFLFVAWNYPYWFMGGSSRHNAQPQAIASVTYRAQGMSSWLMFFDLDEFAVPGEGALSLKEQLCKYDRKDVVGVYFKNRFAGFESRKYESPEDEVYDMNTFYNEIIVAGREDTYRVRSKMIVVPENVDLMGIHQVFSATLPKLAKPVSKKYYDNLDPTPNIPPELIGRVISAKSFFFHLINSHLNPNDTSTIRNWDTVGDTKSRTRYRLFDSNRDFNPVVIPTFNNGAIPYSMYRDSIHNGALGPHLYKNAKIAQLRNACINDARERIISTFSHVLKSVGTRKFNHFIYVGPSFSLQQISDNLLTTASVTLLQKSLGLEIEYCGNSISEPFVDPCTDKHIVDKCNKENCFIYIQPGADWGECIDPAACISSADRTYRDHILKLGMDHNITVLMGPQSLMFKDINQLFTSIASTNVFSSSNLKMTWKQSSAWQFASLNYTGAQSYVVPDLLLVLGKLTTYHQPTVDVVVNLHRNIVFQSVVDGKNVMVILNGKSLCKLIRKETNLTCIDATFESPKFVALSVKKGKVEFLNSSLAQGIMATTTGYVVITNYVRGAMLPYMAGSGVVYVDSVSSSQSYSESIREVFSTAFTGSQKYNCLSGDEGLKEAHAEDLVGLINATVTAVSFYTGKTIDHSTFDAHALSNGEYISGIGGALESLTPQEEESVVSISTSGTGYRGGKKRSKQAKEYLLFYMSGLYFLLAIVICFGPASYYFYTAPNGLHDIIENDPKNNQPYLPVNVNENDAVEHEISGQNDDNVVDDDVREENLSCLELSEVDNR